MMTSDNLYTTHQSVTSIKSQVTTFELLQYGGERIKLWNLESKIDIYLYPSQLEDLNFTSVNLSNTTDSSMFFVQLRLNETNVVPVLVVRPEDLNASITYYVRKGALPSSNVYDMTGTVPDEPEFEESTSSYIIRLDISGLWNGGETPPTYVFIGLKVDYSKFYSLNDLLIVCVVFIPTKIMYLF